jgi:hypothetical protein
MSNRGVLICLLAILSCGFGSTGQASGALTQVLTISGTSSGTGVSLFKVSNVQVNTLLPTAPSVSSFVAPVTGNYQISVTAVICAGGVTGTTTVNIMVDSAPQISGVGGQGNCSSASTSTVLAVTAGHTIGASCQQNAGFAANCLMSVSLLP